MGERSSLKSLKSSRAPRRATSRKSTSGSPKLPLVIIFIILIGAAIFVIGGKGINNIGGDTPKMLTSVEAQERLINFINDTYSMTVKDIEVVETKEESGMYSVTALITDKSDATSTTTLHVSMDGKYFLANAIDMEEIKAKMAEQEAAAQGSQNEVATEMPKSDNPKIELFTMTYCPFGNQAEDGLSPVARLLADNIDIEPHYVIYSDYRGGGEEYCMDEDDKYCSMHGAEELRQGVRELCIYKYYKSKFWDYIDAVNKDCNLNNIVDCWDGPADDLGIDIGDITTCLEDEAMDMLAKEVEIGKKYDVKGSPVLVINGVKYSGGRSPEDYKLGICGAFNEQPEKCSETLGDVTAATSGGCN